jgi:hypothetical protein
VFLILGQKELVKNSSKMLKNHVLILNTPENSKMTLIKLKKLNKIRPMRLEQFKLFNSKYDFSKPKRSFWNCNEDQNILETDFKSWEGNKEESGVQDNKNLPLLISQLKLQIDKNMDKMKYHMALTFRMKQKENSQLSNPSILNQSTPTHLSPLKSFSIKRQSIPSINESLNSRNPISPHFTNPSINTHLQNISSGNSPTRSRLSL